MKIIPEHNILMSNQIKVGDVKLFYTVPEAIPISVVIINITPAFGYKTYEFELLGDHSYIQLGVTTDPQQFKNR